MEPHCLDILNRATKPSAPPSLAIETMPPAYDLPMGVSMADYRYQHRNQLNHLDLFCTQSPPNGERVVVVASTQNDDIGVLSAPYLETPIHACTRTLAAHGIVPGAEVEFFVNGGLVARTVAGDGHDSAVATLGTALKAGDVVEVQQNLIGTSLPSPMASATVTLYPNPTLPPVEITPNTVYGCATVIQVRTAKGAYVELTRTRNGIPSVVAAWSIGQDTDFRTVPMVQAGDIYTAAASLCSTVSNPGTPVTALPTPTNLHQPVFNPTKMYEGQQYVQVDQMTSGGYAELAIAVPGQTSVLPLGSSPPTPTGHDSVFYVPTSPLGRTLQTGDVMEAKPSLCPGSATPTGLTGYSVPVVPCEDLPEPRITTPLAGENFVTVLNNLPGSRIALYDSLNREIADSGGPRVTLLAPRTFVKNEMITAVRRLGACFGRWGFRIRAEEAGQ
jgi:hypothetical protein